MAKHSYEFKKQVVDEYLTGKGSTRLLSQRYGVAHSLVRRWAASYRKFGDEGLKRSRQNKVYTFEFKMRVIELYLSGEMSYQELALSVGINNPPLIARWVNDYRIYGADALMPKRKGHRTEMVKRKKEDIPVSERDSYLKQLEEENLKLRIENAYLKELRRLRLEEEALQRKQRESSTASEENSN